VGLALAAGATLAVIAGDVAVSGVMPGAGDIATAGLVIAAGAVAAAAGLAGAVTGGGGGGGGWPKELKTRVTEQRLAISSVFIGLIGKFLSRLEFRCGFTVCLSSKRQVRVQQNFRICLFDISDFGAATMVNSHYPTFWAVV
jgi:hypothetical protein